MVPISLPEPRVLFEDNHLLIVSKPAGMLVQGDATGDLCLLDWGKSYIKAKYKKQGDVFLGLVHRLDRPVSGLVVLARTSKALTRLSEAFREREVEKIYLAVVDPAPKEKQGRLEDFLMKDSATNTSRRVSPKHKMGQRAVLDYKVVGSHDRGTLVEIQLETGRHHQIRVQLSGAGCPIVGDRKYGSRENYKPEAIMLHAYKLALAHPISKERIEVKAEPEF